MNITSNESEATNNFIVQLNELMHRHKIYGIKLMGVIEDLKVYIKTKKKNKKIHSDFYITIDNFQQAYKLENFGLMGILFICQLHLYFIICAVNENG